MAAPVEHVPHVFSINRVEQLLELLSRNADEEGWTNVELSINSLYQRAYPLVTYVAMRVRFLKVGSCTYAFDETVIDGHISLGRFVIKNAGQFARQYRRAFDTLGRSGSLSVKIRQNLLVPCLPENYVVFTFHVGSPGCLTMMRLEQMISAGQAYEPDCQRRSISPPGPVFHLSVRQ